MADNIANAKSYSVKLVMKMEGDAPNAMSWSQTIQAQLPNSFRKDTRQQAPTGFATHSVNITHRDRPGIDIDHHAKIYRTVPPQKGVSPPLAMLEKLGVYTGKGQRDLGTKSFGSVKCNGFEIDLKEIDPDAGDGVLRVWVNSTTGLPHEAATSTNKPVPMTMRMSEFVWNALIDDSLFDTTPPDGYTNKTRLPKSVAAQVEQIVDSLKLYAKLSGGHYPKVSQIYGDSTRDKMLEMAGFNGGFDKDWLNDPKYQEIRESTGGFGRINVLQRQNPDIKYFGQTVGPKDSDKVLIYWQLDDGSYQVIYGDLRSDAVGADNIKSL